MLSSNLFQNRDQGSAEERLWRAVVAKTLEEWVRGPLRYSRKAEEFLFDDNQDFPAVCSSAGMDPLSLRKRLLYIRARGIQKEANPAHSDRREPTHRRISRSLASVVS